MFDLPPSVVHSTISKMIINEELQVGYAVLLMLCCLCYVAYAMLLMLYYVVLVKLWELCCDGYVVSFQRVLLG